MDFIQYLIEKKIDAKAFSLADSATYNDWERLFVVSSPESFTQQKRFLINKVRRKYHLATPA